MKRSSGVLMPISALPSAYGIGDFGKNAYAFVDLIKKGGFSLWQILPLNPLGFGHSPYQPFSSFAIEELYLDLDSLMERKLIEKPSKGDAKASKVFYEAIRNDKIKYAHEAYENEMKKDPKCLDEFIQSHPWVKDWAAFMMNKRREDLRTWDEWDEKFRYHARGTDLKEDERPLWEFEIWLQKELYGEWLALKKYANDNKVKIIGDVPFYVGFDSADVYDNKECFLLNKETLKPDWIAGVPPDYFSKTGQRWGNPIYDWDHLEKTGFAFLIDRLKRNGELYDIIRLDHFRAFDTFWKIPASCETAIDGSWIEAPGYKFFDIFLKKCPEIEIIAEDLGDLRPEVLVLRDHYNFPGMNVIEFTFNDAMIAHKPGYDKKNMVAYLGTHDNDTLKGFYEKLSDNEKSSWISALDAAHIEGSSINERFINYELGLPADYAIFSLQDLLGLGSEARLNVPGVIDEVNWTWRLKDFSGFEKIIAKLHSLNEHYGRL